MVNCDAFLRSDNNLIDIMCIMISLYLLRITLWCFVVVLLKKSDDDDDVDCKAKAINCTHVYDNVPVLRTTTCVC